MNVFIYVKNQGNQSNPLSELSILFDYQNFPFYLIIITFDWLSSHVWPHYQNMVEPSCRKPWCLSACEKSIQSYNFLICYTLENPIMWLALNISFKGPLSIDFNQYLFG